MKRYTTDNLLTNRDKSELDAQKKLWRQYHESGDTVGAETAHRAAESIRKRYGFSGGTDGSGYIASESSKPLGGKSYNYESAPTYVSKYADQIGETYQELQKKKPFSYDAQADPLYNQYKDQYTQLGAKAMDDTIGKVSSRTGGMASSFATSAAQQANNSYMAELANKVPELQQLAYSMYRDKHNQARENLNDLMNMERTEYGKYVDQLSQYNNDRSFGYGQYSDEWDREHGLGREDVEDTYRKNETEWNHTQENRAYETNEARWKESRQEQKANLMGSFGNFDGYKALGYSDGEIALLKAAYENEKKKMTIGSGGGSSGRSGRRSGRRSGGRKRKKTKVSSSTRKAEEVGQSGDRRDIPADDYHYVSGMGRLSWDEILKAEKAGKVVEYRNPQTGEYSYEKKK